MKNLASSPVDIAHFVVRRFQHFPYFEHGGDKYTFGQIRKIIHGGNIWPLFLEI